MENHTRALKDKFVTQQIHSLSQIRSQAVRLQQEVTGSQFQMAVPVIGVCQQKTRTVSFVKNISTVAWETRTMASVFGPQVRITVCLKDGPNSKDGISKKHALVKILLAPVPAQ